MDRSQIVLLGVVLVLLGGCLGGGPASEAGDTSTSATATHDVGKTITVSDADRQTMLDRERAAVRESLSMCEYNQSGIGGAGVLGTAVINTTGAAAYVEVKVPYYVTELQETGYAAGTRTPTPVEVHADATAKAVYRVDESGVERTTEIWGPSC